MPSSYEDSLWRELRNRKQGQGEKISTYVHCMLSLMNRLKESISEERKVEFILQNMSPEYVLHFRASRPRSVEELRVIGRELERGMSCIEEYKGSRQLTFKNAVKKISFMTQKGVERNFMKCNVNRILESDVITVTASISLEIVRNLAG